MQMRLWGLSSSRSRVITIMGAVSRSERSQRKALASFRCPHLRQEKTERRDSIIQQGDWKTSCVALEGGQPWNCNRQGAATQHSLAKPDCKNLSPAPFKDFRAL
ncbi:hypothetical protein DUI87_20311 [Hirundo rustica rustica]|uniref:Uncharacterized protein n=1 Tax=Hirundo rustica rustica TaxID=333673 RepID=A0A3M0JQ13_HIRRU|nr:hypothetical protein DUI87_20311 [Hirundo rustica rustica]